MQARMAEVRKSAKTTATGGLIQSWYEGTATSKVAAKHASEVKEVNACWCIGVGTGPNFSPDFLTTPDGEMFFGTDYETHYNSNRLGIRFIGPRFQSARAVRTPRTSSRSSTPSAPSTSPGTCPSRSPW